MDTNTTGNISEVVIMNKFIELGATVSIPFGDSPYDLVIEYKGYLYRVQCKTAYKPSDKDGVVKFRTVAGNTSNKSLKSYKGLIDFIAFYSPDTNFIGLIPINNVIEPQMRLRYNKPLNKQENINNINDFEFNKQFNKLKNKL